MDFEGPCPSHPAKFPALLQHSTEVLSSPQRPEDHVHSLAPQSFTLSPDQGPGPLTPGARVFISFWTQTPQGIK